MFTNTQLCQSVLDNKASANLKQESLSFTILWVHNSSGQVHFPFFMINYLFLVVLGLHCYSWTFSICGKWGLLFIVVCGLLIVVVSLAAEHRR